MSDFDIDEELGMLITRRFIEPPSDAGRIYYIACPETERMKIGFTRGSSEKRLRSLQTGSPTELRIFAEHPGFIEDERFIHEHFADTRVHGEWFQLNGRLFALLTYICWVAAVNARYRKQETPIWAQVGLSAIEEHYGPLPTDLGGRLQ